MFYVLVIKYNSLNSSQFEEIEPESEKPKKANVLVLEPLIKSRIHQKLHKKYRMSTGGSSSE